MHCRHAVKYINTGTTLTALTPALLLLLLTASIKYSIRFNNKTKIKRARNSEKNNENSKLH